MISRGIDKVKQTIDYAQMVISHVSDGSGTIDMTGKTTAELKGLLGH